MSIYIIIYYAAILFNFIDGKTIHLGVLNNSRISQNELKKIMSDTENALQTIHKSRNTFDAIYLTTPNASDSDLEGVDILGHVHKLYSTKRSITSFVGPLGPVSAAGAGILSSQLDILLALPDQSFTYDNKTLESTTMHFGKSVDHELTLLASFMRKYRWNSVVIVAETDLEAIDASEIFNAHVLDKGQTAIGVGVENTKDLTALLDSVRVLSSVFYIITKETATGHIFKAAVSNQMNTGDYLFIFSSIHVSCINLKSNWRDTHFIRYDMFRVSFIMTYSRDIDRCDSVDMDSTAYKEALSCVYHAVHKYPNLTNNQRVRAIEKEGFLRFDRHQSHLEDHDLLRPIYLFSPLKEENRTYGVAMATGDVIDEIDPELNWPKPNFPQNPPGRCELDQCFYGDYLSQEVGVLLIIGTGIMFCCFTMVMRWVISHRRKDVGFGSFISFSKLEFVNKSADTDDPFEEANHALATYKDHSVQTRLFRIHRFQSIDSIRDEVELLKKMVHPNVSEVVGFCIDYTFPILISTQCSKGNLQECIAKSSIIFTSQVCLSLMNDVVNGLAYIFASEFEVHGRLTSANCVIDGKLTLKLSDYGLHELYYHVENVAFENKTAKHAMSLLWRAPELLTTRGPGTRRGDIYSIGIIMNEIVSQQYPYKNTEQTLSQIISRIKNVEDPPFRPEINPVIYFDKRITNMIDYCWAQRKDMRPSIEYLKSTIKHVRKHRKVKDIFEHYADTLELMVTKKSIACIEQKSKCEHILAQLIPPAIADKLKDGIMVKPEEYDSVSMFFSDVCGFTSISSTLSAHEVITLVDALNVIFDETCDKYDVLKIDHIGDAVIIVSGAPERNNHHASELVYMSLETIKNINDRLRKPNDSEEPVQVRVGIHSGPVSAGIVGHRRPKYNVFGETARVASIMESSGVPMRVHITKETKDILEPLGMFSFEARDKPIKEADNRMTYLVGETPIKEHVRFRPKITAVETWQKLFRVITISHLFRTVTDKKKNKVDDGNDLTAGDFVNLGFNIIE